MSNKLEDALYRFSDDGVDRKEEVFKNIIQKTNLPVKPKIRYGRYVAAAVSLCFIIGLIGGNFNAVASSINQIINTIWPDKAIMMNEIGNNRLRDIIDMRISGSADTVSEDSLEYQILYKPVQTPCYIYLFYYRGYLKSIILDEQTDNLDEINEWLENNAGIVALAADTPEEAARFLESGEVTRIKPSDIKTVMGDVCMLPVYLPDGRSPGNIIQYHKNFSTVSMTYFYKGKADFDTSGKLENYITIEIINLDTEFGKNLSSNLAVTKNIEICEVNGWDVYFSDGYYVWKTNGFIYVLYSISTMHEENIKIIKNME